MIIVFLLSTINLSAQQNHLVHGGVHFGFEIPLNKKTFNTDFKIYQSLNFKVGAMIRIGYSVFGQIGFYYDVNKLQVENLRNNPSSAVELGFLKIPFLLGYGYSFGTKNLLRVHIGLQYDALVHMSKNKINLEKKEFNIHNMNILGSIGVDLHNISIDISYEKAIKPMAASTESKRYADMLCLILGVVF